MWFDRLIELKKSSGKTVKQISEESGVPLGTLNKLFAGQTKDPKLDTIRAVIHALGYTLDDLDPSPPGENISALNGGEERLIGMYRELNQEGQEKLLGYAVDLTRTGDYKKGRSVRVDTKEA